MNLTRQPYESCEAQCQKISQLTSGIETVEEMETQFECQICRVKLGSKKISAINRHLETKKCCDMAKAAKAAKKVRLGHNTALTSTSPLV